MFRRESRAKSLKNIIFKLTDNRKNGVRVWIQSTEKL